jgi:prephenate dehydrogenase
MDEPGFSLEEANVTVIGLGLMGGSLALCLQDHCRRLNALDVDPQTLELARHMGVAHAAGSDPRELLAGTQMVILACPVPEIIDWLRRLPDYIENDCVVLDIGSSKRAIVSAMKALPERFDPLGGHAICGKEKLSLANAEQELFQGATFVLTPLERSGAAAHSAALQLVELIGARPVWMDAQSHDSALAATSHLPFLLASALSLSISEKIAPELIGPGFRSTARLAGTPSSMMEGVLATNRDNILAEIHVFQERLTEIEGALQAEDTVKLKSVLDLARSRYLNVTL